MRTYSIGTTILEDLGQMHRSRLQAIGKRSNTTSPRQLGRFCFRREVDLGTRRNRPIGICLPMGVSGSRKVEMAHLASNSSLTNSVASCRSRSGGHRILAQMTM